MLRRNTLLLQRTMLVAALGLSWPAHGDPPPPPPPDDPQSANAIVDADVGANDEPADPSAPTVGASLDRFEAHVGDRLTLTVTAIARDAIAATVTLPTDLSLGKFELLDSSNADQDLGDGKKSRRFVLQIATYDLGELEIPSIKLSFRTSAGEDRTASTRAISVRVKPVVEDTKADIQPLRPQREVIIPDTRLVRALSWAGGALAAILVAYIISIIVRRMKRRPALAVIVPARPPHEVARERLRAIRERGGFSVESYRPVHFEMAEVVRGFLGAHFGFDSLEQTTTELLDELARRAVDPMAAATPLPDKLLAAIRGFLEDCDFVKFAKAPSSDAEVVSELERAEAIVGEAMAAKAAAAQAAAKAPVSERAANG